MRLQSISYRGLKGVEGNVTFDKPICIITGDNAAGKTTITDAIRLAFLGRDPKLGKAPEAAFELASGSEMAVTAILDNGVKYIREWRQNGRSVRAQGVVCLTNGHGCPPGLTLDSFPEILFDARAFLAKTARERTYMLFEKVASKDAFDPAEITAKLKAIHVEGHNAKAEHLIAELIEEVETLDQERIELNQPLPDWLAKLVERFKSKESQAAAVVKQMRASAQAQAQVGAASGIPEIAQGVEADIAELREKIEGFVRDQSETEQAIKDDQAWAEATANYRKVLEEPDVTDQLDRVTIRGEELLASVKGRTPKAPAARETLLQVSRITEEIQRKIDASASNLSQMRKDLKNLVGSGCCPECSRKWTKKLIEERQARVIPVLESEQKLFNELVNTALAQAQENQRAAQEAYDMALEQDEELRVMGVELARLAEERTALSAKVERRKTAMEFLKTAETRRTDTNLLQTTLASIKGQLAFLRTELTERESAQRKAIAARATKIRQEREKEMLDENLMTQAVTKEANKILLDEQRRIIDKCVGAFMGDVSVFVGGVFGRKLEYVDGEIGYYRGKKFVTMATFCGAEEYLAYAGLALALAHKSPIRIVVLDELGRLKSERKKALIGIISQMVEAGKLDNFVGIDPELDPAYSPDVCKIISV